MDQSSSIACARLAFYTVLFCVYLVCVTKSFKFLTERDVRGVIPMISGSGMMLFSFAFQSMAEFLLSGGDFFTSFTDPKDISIGVFTFFVYHLFDVFHISGIILLVYGIARCSYASSEAASREAYANRGKK